MLIYINRSGPNQWRDSQKPTEILADMCKDRRFSYVPPNANNLELCINEQIFRLNDYGKKKCIKCLV